MPDTSVTTMAERFSAPKDQRAEGRRRYLLLDILVMAIDGRQLRRSHDYASGKSATRMVSV